jgi:serine phosphatase RsbU (regulator of sigma subunit)
VTERSVDRWLAQAARSPFPGGRVILLAVLFGVVLCALGGFLAWRSYQSRVEQAESRIATAAAEAARASEQFFSDRIAVLEVVTDMPVFDEPEPADLGPVLQALDGQDLGFDGGVGWADETGELVVSTSLDEVLLPFDLSGRDYATVVLESRLPFVGAARQSSSGSTVIPVAVPTFADNGELTGMLVAGIRSETLAQDIPALAPVSIDVRVVDRSGEMVLVNGAPPEVLGPPVNHDLLSEEPGTIVVGEGLRGDMGRIAAVERADSAGWVVVAEQSRALALQNARSRLIGELAVLAAFTLVTLGAALYAAQRLDDSHREMIRGARDLGAMEVLSERLSTATDTRSIAGAAIGVYREVFEAGAVVVGLVSKERAEMRVFVDASTGTAEYAVPVDQPSILSDALESDEPLVTDARTLAELYPDTEQIEADPDSGVIAGRFVGAEATGAIGIYLRKDFPPAEADLELFEAMAPMLGDPFGRAEVAERERHASRTFQDALLPQDSLGIDVPLQRAVRYQAAVGDVEVGGDWYDLWMIDDHRVGIVVGDVVGRGVVAAAAMGQLRSAVRAAVGAAMTPTDALGYVDALTRQITGSAGATVVLGVLDLRNGSVRLASAGHLPPLVVEKEGVRVLWDMSGTPLGFFPSGISRRGMALKLEPEDTLVLYSDGLIERRDEVIDEGIARAAKVLEQHSDHPVEALADAMLDQMAIPDNPDDVALVVVRPVTKPPRHFTGVVSLGEFDRLHASLVAWLEETRQPHAEETADRVEETVTTILGVAGGQQVQGDVMVEVDPDGERMSVVVEFRKRPGPPAGLERRILRAWGGGEVTTRGPRLSFVVD